MEFSLVKGLLSKLYSSPVSSSIPSDPKQQDLVELRNNPKAPLSQRVFIASTMLGIGSIMGLVGWVYPRRNVNYLSLIEVGKL